MFAQPAKDAGGCIQMCQYACWVEGVTGASVYDPTVLCHLSLSTPSEDTLRNGGNHLHTTIQHARRCCDALRDGHVLRTLLDKLSTKAAVTDDGEEVKTANTAQQSNGRSGGSVSAKARTLIDVLHRIEGIVGPPALPSAADVYAGKFEAIGQVLFRLFHHFVVRDRFAFFPQMMQWYAKVCSVYGRGFKADLETLDVFCDGTVWLLTMHNMSRDVPLELCTCYLNPRSDVAKVAANISFVQCLFDVHGVFSYFPSVAAFMAGKSRRPNSHFLFMQSFHVFQHFRRSTLRPMSGKIAFADGSLDCSSKNPPLSRDETSDKTHSHAQPNGFPTQVMKSSVRATSHADPASPRKSGGSQYHLAAHIGKNESPGLSRRRSPTASSGRSSSSRPAAHVGHSSALRTVSPNVTRMSSRKDETQTSKKHHDSLSVDSAHSGPADEAHHHVAGVACMIEQNTKLQVEQFRIRVNSANELLLLLEVENRPTSPSPKEFVIPLAAVERCKLCSGHAPAVVLYCNAPLPKAMPPYSDGRSFPSVTFFFATQGEAERLYKRLFCEQGPAAAGGEPSVAVPTKSPAALAPRTRLKPVL